MEASACSGCITLSPVHEAKEPKSPQKRLDGAKAEERGSTKLDGAANPKGAAANLKKRTLFQENEEETIRVTVTAAGGTDCRVDSKA